MSSTFTTRFILVAALFIILGACGQKPQTFQQQILALGTLVDIAIYDVDEATAASAVTTVSHTMEAIHHNWHAWQPGKLSYINLQLATGREVALDDEQAALIQTGIDLARQSNDLFNPTIGKLIALWGFHQDEQLNMIPPTESEIAALLATAPKMSELKIENGKLSSPNPAVMLDVGGFAKGYAVDQAIMALQKMGIENAIVNAGGDLRAIGSKGGKPWRIGIRHPRQAGVIASLETHGDESVFTSGDYERYFIYQGKRYHHIIDPHSGYPAQGSSSITIIHSDATTADAAATALFIAGPGWRETAKAMGITEVMLIDSEGTAYMTEAMHKRLHFETDTPPKTVVVP